MPLNSKPYNGYSIDKNYTGVNFYKSAQFSDFVSKCLQLGASVFSTSYIVITIIGNIDHITWFATQIQTIYIILV